MSICCPYPVSLVVLEMVNFTWLRLVKFIPISDTTLVVFIPNFTATHAITSTYLIFYEWHYLLVGRQIFIFICYIGGGKHN